VEELMIVGIHGEGEYQMVEAANVALITGGARGIGLGISKCMLASGYDLAICGSRPPEAAAEVVQELSAGGNRVVYYQCDVADRRMRETMLDGIREDFGRLHLLVNNAGVTARVRDDVMTMTEENYQWLMQINLQGPFFLTQSCAAWMIEQQEASADFRGCIVNISSISARVASLNRGEYCMSKAGLSMATQLWATRLGEFDIPVYEIQPGLIRSDMTASAIEKYDKLIAEGLLIQRRWGEPEDVGRAVAMLARGDLTYSTGQVIMVDGGMMVPRL
jgi:NAD(P)-dependent dehydrogenase (short-subunit alcohol dehydrogenase family)